MPAMFAIVMTIDQYVSLTLPRVIGHSALADTTHKIITKHWGEHAMDDRQFVRTCQSCGYKLVCSPPDSKTFDRYRERKCPKCKSIDFDYGSYKNDDLSAGLAAEEEQ